MPLPKEEAWFPRKTHGWGWGVPRRWQGWVVLVGFIGALVAGAPLAVHNRPGYVAYTVVLAGIMTVICYWKGEKPGWHWGD